MARSLNSVQLIGNLTRDPELRYTPAGTAVATIGIATNRSWTTDTGEKKEDTEFHRVVVWNKLAELCSQLLSKGAKVYFHGRLSTRSYTTADGQQKSTTEIVADDMIVLSSKKAFAGESAVDTETVSTSKPAVTRSTSSHSAGSGQASAKEKKQEVAEAPEQENQDVSPDDIPF